MCQKKSNLSAAIPSRKCYLLQNIETNSPICNKLADKTSFSHWVGCGVNSLNRLRRHLAACWLGGLVSRESGDRKSDSLEPRSSHFLSLRNVDRGQAKEICEKKKRKKKYFKGKVVIFTVQRLILYQYPVDFLTLSGTLLKNF